MSRLDWQDWVWGGSLTWVSGKRRRTTVDAVSLGIFAVLLLVIGHLYA